MSQLKVRVGDYFNRGSSNRRYNCDQDEERLNSRFSKVESEHESRIEKVVRHPRADVALIKMKNCVEEYTKFIQPVCLPESLHEFSDDICGIVSGWGKSDPNQVEITTFNRLIIFVKSRRWKLQRSFKFPRLLIFPKNNVKKSLARMDIQLLL